MNEEIYNKIADDFEKYCKQFNVKNTVCDFDFTDDNQGDLTVYDFRFMEDEDCFKEDAIGIFKDNGINPVSVEWDYDCGYNEYDRYCCLKIIF